MSARRDRACAEALQLFRGGQVLAAEQACLRRLETDPDDIEALKIVAVAALRRGDAVRAIAKLARAAALDPKDAIARYHLARAHEMAGNDIASLAWYDTALQLAPQLHVARLGYGAALERAGHPERALWQWARALRDAQAAGRWTDADSTPSGLRPLVERAVRAVRLGAVDFIEKPIDDELLLAALAQATALAAAAEENAARKAETDRRLARLTPRDEVKLVVADRADYDAARALVRGPLAGFGGAILIGAVHGAIDARTLAEWVLADRLPVRLQVQLHKLLWPGEERGV